jgi:hypothetical protein
LNIDWKKYSRRLKPILLAAELTLLKRNIVTPIMADESTMVYFRPRTGMRYARVPSRTPMVPGR